MGVGDNIEHRGHIVGFKEEIDKQSMISDASFFKWFDNSINEGEAFIKGNWDFSYHIIHHASDCIHKPEEKSALEIGYGGGRLIAAASRFFNNVIGIDVHTQKEIVEKKLSKMGVNNVTLLITDGTKIPIEDNSIDFVYSFIVFQHIEKYEIFKGYLEEIHRVLKNDGLAVIYFGRWYFFSFNRSSRFFLLLDQLLEFILLRTGFKEISARVNCTNLQISKFHAKSLAERIGFKVIRTIVSRRRVPDGFKYYGGQNGIILRK